MKSINLLNCILFFAYFIISTYSTEQSSVLIIIRGQPNLFHHKIALDTQSKLEATISKHKLNAKVLLMHREWPVEAAWSIFPLIPDISMRYAQDFNWVMFIEEHTKVNLLELISKVLPKYDHDKKLLLGRCLHDDNPTIIHHFAFFDGDPKTFKYPDLQSGIIFSSELLMHIQEEWKVDGTKASFQIDVKHEIAKHLFDQYDIRITCVEELCGPKHEPKCATQVGQLSPDCGGMMSLDQVQFSVKTTKKFHEDRVKVVKETWGRFSSNIIYYSNVTDDSIPTIDCGVPNTESGHCGKMEAIIRDMYNNPKLNGLAWLVIADDDTILSVSRMLKLLNCYNPDSTVVLGERYGFGLNSGYGYSYITGGGSMVMSRKAVKDFVRKGCKCPIISAPDDMYLGQCFTNTVGIPVVHSTLFHQARPEDYSVDFLANQEPISFHKHWMIDPIQAYKKWFEKADILAFGEKDLDLEPKPSPEPQALPIPPTPLRSDIKDEL